MRDLFSWSFPLGRLFGITIRIHLLFPIVALALIGRAASEKDAIPGTWIDATMLMGLMFFSILLHEFGHCFGGRMVEGDAHEVLLWPLGGLASVEVPHTPRANFIMVAAGPAVNLVLFLFVGLLFCWATDFNLRPPWNPLWYPYRDNGAGEILLTTWNGDHFLTSQPLVVMLARFCWINWVLFLFNIVLVGFPMDSGRLVQCAFWKYSGSYRDATMKAVWAGFFMAVLLLIISIVKNEVLIIALAFFIYQSCRQQLVILETGGEEQLFGYDFSQGYTSLERDQPAAAPPRRKQPGMIQRWLQKRQQRKQQREQEEREAEERRMDELLEKVQRDGLQSLTDEERRFLTRVSARYRNRH